MLVSNFIWVFFDNVIKNKDNNPTKLSVLMYCYFQMLYNFGTIFKKTAIQSTDRVKPLPGYNELKAKYTSSEFNDNERLNILENFLYIGHSAFLAYLYKTVPMSRRDYGIKPYEISSSVENNLIQWSIEHVTGKTLELSRAGFSTKNTTGLRADYIGGKTDKKYWEQLIVPTGVKRGVYNLPLIDFNDPLSYKIQNFLGKEFYLNSGFAVNPTKNIINLQDEISKTWDTGLKEQMDKLLEVYTNLDDSKKMTAELFAGSSAGVLPPPGFFICLATQLSQKYKQNTQNDLAMYFSLSAGIFDACCGAWWYKANYEQARPINLIRNNYTDNYLKTWTPLAPGQLFGSIPGKRWLPYQEFTFVTPPFPDVASGHTTFSQVAARILDWWFNNPVLYDGFTCVNIPNEKIICPSLNLANKVVCLGEYILQKGSSMIEPGVTPKSEIVFRYKTLRELADSAGLSRIYGGIHSFQTNEVSAKLAEWIANQTIPKLKSEFKFSSPYGSNGELKKKKRV